jgi:hypothetical protein
MKDEMNSAGPQLLRLPLQAAPVERTLAAAQPVVGQEGVVPSNVAFLPPRWTDFIMDMTPPISPGWGIRQL